MAVASDWKERVCSHKVTLDLTLHRLSSVVEILSPNFSDQKLEYYCPKKGRNFHKYTFALEALSDLLSKELHQT